jgi:hypothetical protein
MALPDGVTQIFADIVRFSTLDANGFPAVGAATWSTAGLIKVTLTPVVEGGDDIAVKQANGNLAAWYRHGDMQKYQSIEIDLSRPDVNLEALLAGGTVLNDSTTTAVATPGTVTATGSVGAGVIPLLSVLGYRVSAYNQYGETICSAEATLTLTGSMNTAGLAWAVVTGAVGYKIYGRIQGAEQFIARVTTNSYTDLGTITPVGALPAVNTTAGPGAGVGYAAPNMGIVGNPNGVSVELFGKATINGVQATSLPYWRWVIPGVKNLVAQQRDFTNALLQNQFNGQAFPNPNWGGGPFGDWQFASAQVVQRARCGVDIVPADALTLIAATA